MRNMQRSNENQLAAKIRFLEDQLISLDHYLPETYEYLMRELDNQKYLMAQHQVKQRFHEIETAIPEKSNQE